MNLYEKYFFEQIVKVQDKLKTRIHTGTDADNRLHANLVPNYKKKNPNDCPEVDKLKKSAAEFSKLAGKAKLSQCGEQNRLCVEVDKAAGLFGKKNIDFAVIKGY